VDEQGSVNVVEEAYASADKGQFQPQQARSRFAVAPGGAVPMLRMAAAAPAAKAKKASTGSFFGRIVGGGLPPSAPGSAAPPPRSPRVARSSPSMEGGVAFSASHPQPQLDLYDEATSLSFADTSSPSSQATYAAIPPPPPPLAAAPPPAPIGLSRRSTREATIRPGSSGNAIESLARQQGFDGSFPDSDALFKTLLGLKAKPAQPKSLATLNGADNTKAQIWSTIVTLGFFHAKLMDEKESWALIGDKAKEYVRDILENEFGVQAVDVDTLTGDWIQAAKGVF